jgi:hypothetical protein
MNLKSFKEFNNDLIKESEYRYHRDYNPYYNGKTAFSRWMRGMSSRFKENTSTTDLRNDPYAESKLQKIAFSNIASFITGAVGVITDLLTPARGDKKYEYRNRGRLRFEEEYEKRKRELVEKWEKENIENKSKITDEDAEDFYKSGVLAGKKKFGDNFDPEKPKGDEQRLYSSYMSDVMHKYYNKIDHGKKGS